MLRGAGRAHPGAGPEAGDEVAERPGRAVIRGRFQVRASLTHKLAEMAGGRESAGPKGD